MNKFKDLLTLIKQDGYRYIGKYDLKGILMLYLRTPGFKYIVRLRVVRFCKTTKSFRVFFPLAYFLYRRAMIKYGIIIPYMTNIGKGFYIGHFGGIVVNSNVVIGDNVNLSHGVTIGQGGDDENKGCPVIGNNIYIGPNSTIIGKIRIGDGAAIGANAFVNKDVQENTTVGGVPAKTISNKGSVNYIHNKV